MTCAYTLDSISHCNLPLSIYDDSETTRLQLILQFWLGLLRCTHSHCTQTHLHNPKNYLLDLDIFCTKLLLLLLVYWKRMRHLVLCVNFLALLCGYFRQILNKIAVLFLLKQMSDHCFYFFGILYKIVENLNSATQSFLTFPLHKFSSAFFRMIEHVWQAQMEIECYIYPCVFWMHHCLKHCITTLALGEGIMHTKLETHYKKCALSQP